MHAQNLCISLLTLILGGNSPRENCPHLHNDGKETKETKEMEFSFEQELDGSRSEEVK